MFYLGNVSAQTNSKMQFGLWDFSEKNLLLTFWLLHLSDITSKFHITMFAVDL